MRNTDQIWIKLKAGDRNAFKQLFNAYYQDLYRYGFKFCDNRQMTEDELQNLFLKLWLNRESLGDVQAVKTYLWTALRRRLITTVKKKKKELNRIEQPAVESSFFLSVEDFIIKREEEGLQREYLKKFIHVLSPKQREILYLKFYEGMSYEEIEEIMGVNYQVARNYLYLGLQKLRERLPEEATVLLTFLFGLTAI